MPSRGTPDHGMEVQGPTQTLEYLNTVSVYVCRYAGLQAGSVTGKMLVDAGVQVLRRPAGGHSHLHWPHKLDTPTQCFNCMQAAKQVMGVEGWQQAVGLSAAEEPVKKEAVTAATMSAAPTTHQHANGSAAGDIPKQRQVSTAAAPIVAAATGAGHLRSIDTEPWRMENCTSCGHTYRIEHLEEGSEGKTLICKSCAKQQQQPPKPQDIPGQTAAAASGDSRPAAAPAKKPSPSLPAAAAGFTKAKPEVSQPAGVELQPISQPGIKADAQQQQQQQQQTELSREGALPASSSILPQMPTADVNAPDVVAADGGGTAQDDLQQRKQVQFQPVAVPETTLGPAAPAGSGELLLSPSASTVGDAPVDTHGCRPGWGFARPDKEAIVLDGLAQKLSAIVNKQITGAELRSLGLRAVKEARSLRRQYSLWWPGVMASAEPIHCIPSYHWAAVRLLADIPCREKLGVSLTEAALQQAAAAAASSGGSAGAAAVAAATSERVPGKRKRARDGVAAAAAAAAAGDDGVDAEYVPAQRSPKRLKHMHAQNYLLQHNAAAGGVGSSHAPQKGVAAEPAAAAAPDGHHRRLMMASSTVEVMNSMKHVMEELSTANTAATEVSNLWRRYPQKLQDLPGSKFLVEGTNPETWDKFASDASTLRSELKQDRSILKHMLHAHNAAAAAGVNGSSGAALAAAKRKPFLAFRDALGACVDDAVSWLQHAHQQRLMDRARAIIEVRCMYDMYQDLVGGKQVGTAASNAGVSVGAIDVQQQQLQQKKSSKLGPKSPKAKTAAAAGGNAAAAGQPSTVAAAKQQQQHHHHHHHHHQSNHQQQQQQEDSGDPGQELNDEELELLQQEQRYNDVVAAAAQAAAAAATQDQQQQGPGLSGRQGSAGGTVLTFLQQFMNG